MPIKKTSVAYFLAFSVCVGFTVSAEPVPESMGTEDVNNTDATIEKMNCVRLMLRAAKNSLKSLSFCSRQLKANYTTNKELAEKIGCVMKCTMQRVSLINAEGFLTEEALMSEMRKYLPKEGMVEEARAKVYLPCVESASKLDPTQENCRSYAEYALCMQSGMEDFINTSPYCLPRIRI